MACEDKKKHYEKTKKANVDWTKLSRLEDNMTLGVIRNIAEETKNLERKGGQDLWYFILIPCLESPFEMCKDKTSQL